MRGRIGAALLALGSTAGLVALAQVPWTAHTPGEALLRLSWRTRGELVEECRRLTAEELAELPAHMRREEVCEGRLAPYVLTLRLDGRQVLHDSIAPGGARADRPIYVLRELPIAAGAHRIELVFEGARAAAEDASEARMTLDAPFTAGPGEIVLITRDEDTRRLVVR